MTSLEPVHEALRAQRDFVFKKVFSRFSSDIIIRPQTPADVAHVIIDEANPWVIQPYLGAEQYCSYSVVRDGVIQAHGTYPTTHTAGLGASTYFEHMEVEPIYRWIETFVRAIGYTGQIAFDFIKTPEGAAIARSGRDAAAFAGATVGAAPASLR